MVSTLQDLDNKISDLGATIGQAVTDIQTLLTKVGQNPDFTNEVNALQTSLDALKSADAAMQSALTPPPTP